MKMNLCFFNRTKKWIGTIAGLLVINLSVAQTNVFDNIIAVSPDHTYLAAAITQQNLQGALQNPAATLTVFAPTNAAFDALAASLNTDIAGLLALPNLTDVLLYHVLGTTVVSGDLSNGITPQPLNAANTIKITVTQTNQVFANQAQVTTPDLTANNGVVHVTNGVLLPNTTVVDLAINNGFTILTTAVIQQELVPTLSNPFGTFTVLAPTDAAFAALLSDLGITAEQLLESADLTDYLLYHVFDSEILSSDLSNGLIAEPISETNTIKVTVTGSGDVFFNHAQVVLANVEADNGVVHAIDAVILPVNTVVDVAIDNNFTYLTTALIQEELVPTLSNPFAEFTVFAPTNQAFEELAAALSTDIAGLLALENLTTVLLYHVVAGTVASTDLTNGTVNTLADLDVTVNITGGVTINNSNVTLADVAAFNGIVHVIDRVLVPGGSPVSIDDFDNVTITAYPNPSSTVVSFTGLEKAELSIVDINGSVVFTGKYTGNPIDISDLSSGMYFIYISSEQNTAVVRLSVK
jgi:uncharacterized surface protein with fasciclin (FAS1) repeats